MSLIELWQRPPKSIPEPSYRHCIKDDPLDMEELLKMSQIRLKDEYAANDYEGAW